ncbi:hypothetical protein [Streptomyces sp. NPDC093260]|uniref:hypothetical protein n=1 Tax=Streptomyces sp. NPDC093260 TaxID=3155073 RepID=UPI00341F478D
MFVGTLRRLQDCGFSTKETALIMGITEATVRPIRRTAKHRLATAMGYRTDHIPETDKE